MTTDVDDGTTVTLTLPRRSGTGTDGRLDYAWQAAIGTDPE